MSRYRILRILNRFNLGGPTHVAALLTRYLPADFETLLAAGFREESEAGSESILERYHITPRYIPHMQRSVNDPFADAKALKEVLKLIREYQPHIIHTHAAKAGLLGRLAAEYYRKVITVHSFQGHVFHSYFSPLKTAAIIQTERFLGRLTDAVVAISAEQKKELAHIYRIAPEKKIHLIPDGFDLSSFLHPPDEIEKRNAFRQKYHLEPHHLAVGLIGRLVPIKNQTLFLRAAALLQESESDRLRFFLIGDGETADRYKTEAEELNLKPPYLQFTSWIYPIEEALFGLDLVALTSLNEGAPVTLIEAQAAGKPVVSTRVGGIPDCTREGVTALLTPSGDAEAFAGALRELGRNPEKRIEMGKQGKIFARNEFHYSRMTERMANLYYKLLER